MKTHIFLLLLVLDFGLPAYAAADEQDACRHFFQVLKAVPHDKIIRSDGAHQSLWDRKKYTGCEVQFVTNDTLLSDRSVPDFEAMRGTEMYRRGWRQIISIRADGPGTGIFGIEKESLLCLVRHDQPASLEDHGKIVQSETLTISVQCRQKSMQ